MIEFTVALIAILAVVVGMLMLNRIETAHTGTMLQSRADAGALALDVIYRGSVDAQFISDWDPAGDDIRYTHDDEAGMDPNAASQIATLVADADFATVENLPMNALVRIGSSPSPIELFMVEGSQETTVDLADIPAVEHLFTGAPNITVKSEAWLTWTEGIY